MWPVEWVDNLSDWRWISNSHDIYGPNPNLWHLEDPTVFLVPKKFLDSIRNEENEHANDVQDTIANHLLDKQYGHQPSFCKKYRCIFVLPLNLSDVSIANIPL